MLNYANLNDMEFEALCKDIMERMLGVSLRRFGPGRDHGVDLTDDVSTKSVVVQIKHYRNSTTDQLVRSLKNELPKVTELAPQHYYICCSRELSADNINAVYQHFQAYMASDRNIVTLIEIDDFLKQEVNRDILKKHFKLWLDSTGILEELFNDDIFVDCEALLSDVDELQKLFVRTSAFDKALKVLESNQPLCIIGDPGVGKSITSKMLVLHYAAQGYRVRYTTDVTDLKSLKRSLRDDAETKEVILLDDCFGQAYFEMKTSQSSELVTLIKYVKLHPNKVLILNSRVTIFQEARERQQALVRCMDRNEFRVHVLDMNNLSGEEKAKILYNHLAFSDIPDEYFENIRVNRRYHNIISHRNYNPRIIEFVCNPNRYSTIPATQFFEYIMKQLGNPQEIWVNEYDDRLQPADRILLQTIYSMTTTTVNADLVRRCFEHRIAGIPTIDKTLDQYTRSLNRLNEGFIKIIDNRGTKELSMQNPSVNDFMDAMFQNNHAIFQNVCNSITCVLQLRLLQRSSADRFLLEKIRDDKFDDLIFPDEDLRISLIGHMIFFYRLRIAKYRQMLLKFLMHQFDPSSSNQCYTFLPIYHYGHQFADPEIWSFYDLRLFFEEGDHLYQFLMDNDFLSIVQLVKQIDHLFEGSTNIGYKEQVDCALYDILRSECYVDADYFENELYDEIEEAVESARSLGAEESAVDMQVATSNLDAVVGERTRQRLRKTAERLPQHFYHVLDFIEELEIYVEGSYQLISNYLDDWRTVLATNKKISMNDHESDESEGYSPIDAIFER